LDLVQKLIASGTDVNAEASGGTALARAARRGFVEIVKALVKAGANPSWGGERGRTPLKCAIEEGQVKAACVLIEAGAEITRGKIQREPMLHLAARLGHPQIVRALLKAGADPQERDYQGETALEAAEECGDKEVLRILKEAGGGARTDTPELKLLAAAEDGDEKTVRALIEAHVDVETKDERATRRGMTALMLASAAGHATIVESLLEAGANPNACDLDEDHERHVADMIKWSSEEYVQAENLCVTALMYAANRGHADIVRVLMKAGARVNARGYGNHTELMLAARNGNPAVIEALIEAGADVNMVNAGRSSALHFAAAGGHLEDVRLLMTAGAKLSRKNRDGLTPVAAAAQAGHADVVKLLSTATAGAATARKKHPRQPRPGELVAAVGATHWAPTAAGATQMQPLPEEQVKRTVAALLEAGADANGTDKDGVTALMKAADYGHLDVAKMLFAAGADVNLRSKDGSTALYYAVACYATARSRQSEMVALLLQHKAETESRNTSCGRTPLIYAVAYAPRETVASLLDHGADIRTRDNEGETPLHFAVRHQRTETVALLLDRGAEINAPNDEGRTPLGLALDEIKYADRPDRKDEKAALEKIIATLRKRGAKETAEPAAKQKRRVVQRESDSKKRWGPDIALPDFTKPAEDSRFKQALAMLSRKLRCKPGPLPAPFPEVKGASSFDVTPEVVDVKALQQEVIGLGCFFFAGKILHHSTVVALPTADKYEAIAAMQTNGANYGVGPGAIIAWLKYLEKEQPFLLTEIGFDVVAGEFLQPVADAKALAKRMYEFCPDIVDQGTQTVGALAKELRKTNRLYLWWD
jgi:ankyrin repeat protein